MRSLENKVFGVGLARTGTTSLHQAMTLLGLKSAPDSIALLDGMDTEFLRAHDAFFDNPIPFRYQALEQTCPNSKWIVTQRPVEAWITSMEWLFGPGLDRLSGDMRTIGDRVHRQLYGSDQFDETRLRAIYHQHYEQLAEWVRGRPAVWIDIDDGFGWSDLCPLLGMEPPPVDFPHANKAQRGGRSRR